jgi:hypothetical protein
VSPPAGLLEAVAGFMLGHRPLTAAERERIEREIDYRNRARGHPVTPTM